MVSPLPLFFTHILIKMHAASQFIKYLSVIKRISIMTSLNSRQGGHFKHKSKKKKKSKDK